MSEPIATSPRPEPPTEVRPAPSPDPTLSRGPVKPADALWLQDSHTNRMIISGVYAVDQLDVDTLRTLFHERVLSLDGGERFPRFFWRVVWSGRKPYWELDPNFDVSRHIVVADDPKLSTKEGLQDYMGAIASEALPADRPPWQLQLVPHFEGSGSAILFRLHHCLGDGVGLVPILFSMMDPAETGSTGSSAADRHAGKTGKKAMGSLGMLVKAPLLGPFVLLGKMLQKADRSGMHGAPLSGEKRVAWSPSIDLERVKRLKQAAGATINDVLMTCVAGALRGHYHAQSGQVVERVRATVPVDVRSPKQPLKMENKFASVLLELPSGIEDTRERLTEVRRRMNALKRSVEPLAMFGAVKVLLTLLPQRASSGLADFLANKCTCILTNVPGPQEPIYLAGRQVRDMLFWVPQRADIGIGISILSFAGTVRVGVLSDVEVMSEPALLIEHFERELGLLESAFL